MKEGRLRIDAAGHEIYYRLFGSGPETLVGLHGGPGADHRYLLRLGELAHGSLQVLLYDQLGSGQSDRPDDDSLWTVPRFVAELEAVRQGLGLGRVHLLGQSWGGMLALQYALDHPKGVKSLLLSNTGSSTLAILRGMTQLRAELPADILLPLLRHEATGDWSHPEYQEAFHRLYARHLRRSTPFEPEQSLKELREILLPLMKEMGPAYGAMWGPQEFVCTGPLLEWDVTERLGEIAVPTLILCGWYDELTVDVHRLLADRICDNEFLIFGNSSHVIILEKEADAYLGAIRHFVERVSARGQ
jgi:proline-specific peptidase